MNRPRMLNEKEKSGRVGAIVLGVLSVLLILFFCFVLWLNMWHFGVLVSGSSMYDTLKDGDYVYASRYFELKRGDIIIIDVSEYREEDGLSGDYLVKRLIATEGDSVYCRDGVLYRKDAGGTEYYELQESYATGETQDFAEVTVGEGEIFFLGDNRPVSKDSRVLGCYLESDVIGVVPPWAVAIKEITGGWERFVSFITGRSASYMAPHTN